VTRPQCPPHAESYASLSERQLDRRGLLRGAAAAGAALLLPPSLRAQPAGITRAWPRLPPCPSDRRDAPLQLAEGHEAQVLLRWGEPLHEGAPAFDWRAQSAGAQRRQFGFNCDFNAFMPLTPGGSERGLLCSNHEYISPAEMFPGYRAGQPSAAQVGVEMEALGMSVVELSRAQDGRWRVLRDSRFNRRLSATTPMTLSGPAAGAPLLRTAADPSGKTVLGTFGNCSGGKTPWGTVLTCEENFQDMFGRRNEPPRDGQAPAAVEPSSDVSPQVAELPARYGLRRRSVYHWEDHHDRFDLSQPGSMHEPHRFGWVVELDPYDPESTPIKRTALGRMRHESAVTGVSSDGHAVVYTGDDQRQQYLYKFVSADVVTPGEREANRDLLDHGTLFVARLEDDGTGAWMPLRPEGALAHWTQAEILVNSRGAARQLGATPMDRPEDVEIHPRTQRVYVVMTKDAASPGDNAANRRRGNIWGHVLELDEDGGRLSAQSFTWRPFLLCGPPGDPAAQPVYYGGADPAELDPLACPDNLAFDPAGRLWIATDGQPRAMGWNDSLYAVSVYGPHDEVGLTRRFLNGPTGCEICGPEFTPDGRSLFVNIQHPGQGGGLAQPTSRWPDGELPRPSVVAIRRSDGARIGS